MDFHCEHEEVADKALRENERLRREMDEMITFNVTLLRLFTAIQKVIDVADPNIKGELRSYLESKTK